MTGKVRIGLAGLGRMGRIHARNLTGPCRHAELSCVYDADPAVARSAAKEFGVPWAASLDELVDSAAIDALAVATPTGTHADFAIAGAAAGKHVFCEKPISLQRDAAVRALEAVAAAGVKFQVGFHRRFDPDWVAAVHRIRSGELGDPYLFRTSLRDKTPPRVEFLAGSGGFFVDVTIHDLDTARWMVGEVVEVSAHGAAMSDPEFEKIGDIDTAVVVLRFENGALGVIDNSRAAGYGYECSTEVMGSKATVRIDNPRLRNYEWRTPGVSSYDLVHDFEHRYPLAYASELDSFAKSILSDLQPEVTGHDALAAFDLALAVDEAWRSGSAVAVTPQRTSQGVVYQRPEAA